MRNLFLGLFVFTIFSFNAEAARADLLSAWVRGDGIYLQGDSNLDYFSDNKLGPGFGFAVGLEAFFVDFMLDANFFPDGAQFNQLGVGFDADLLPISAIQIAPTGQVFYAFGKFDNNARESIKALHFRAGLQVGVNFAKYIWLNVEGFTGYLLTTPDVGAGFVFSGGANLTFRVDLLDLFTPTKSVTKGLVHQPSDDEKSTTKSTVAEKKKKAEIPSKKNDEAWTP